MGGCRVENCVNSTKTRFRLFRFPIKDVARRNLWLDRCGLRITPGCKWENWKICEAHFQVSDIEQAYSNGYMQLKRDAVPSIFSGNYCKITDVKVRSPLSEIRANSCRLNNVNMANENILMQQNLPIVIPHGDDHQQAQDENLPAQDENLPAQGENLPAPGENLPAQDVNLPSEVEILKKRVLELCNRNKQLCKENAHLRANSLTGYERLKKVFNEDQISLLERDLSKNSRPWTPETLRKGFAWRCVMNVRPYEFLRKNKDFGLLPMPSIRTLHRHIEHIVFKPGICDQAIKWLGVKVRAHQDEKARMCVLSLDEMSVRPRVEYDKALDCYLGLVSPEIARNEEEAQKKADHVLAVMARGLTSHWKQTVAYVLTGPSICPNRLWEFLVGVMRALHDEELFVRCVSSDMGPVNVALWAKNGIRATAFGVVTSCPHPVAEGERLHFAPDESHLMKITWGQLLRSVFFLPSDIIEKYHLPSSEVKIDHVKELFACQEEKGGGRIVPELRKEHIEPSQFDKMRVGLATSFFSERMSAGLCFAAVNVPSVSREAETTGWFFGQVAEWHRLMSSRHRFDSLSRDAHGRQRVEFLQDFISWFKRIKFSPNSAWKPIQTGTRLLTQSALDLMEDLINRLYLEYLLTNRLGTQGVENLFSQVRGGGNIHPGPVRVRQMLRLLAVAMFMAVPSSASYPDEEEKYYVDFLQAKKTNPIADDDDDVLLHVPDVELTEIQNNGLYFMAGWAVKEILGNCDECNRAVRSEGRAPGLPSEWTHFYSKGGLIHPTQEAFEVVGRIERVFIGYGEELIKIPHVKRILKDEVTKASLPTSLSRFPACHSIFDDLIAKFLSLRLHILAKDASRKFDVKTVFSSKSGFLFTASAKVGKNKSPLIAA